MANFVVLKKIHVFLAEFWEKYLNFVGIYIFLISGARKLNLRKVGVN